MKKKRPISTVRPTPCEACPYRKDVPSGVWSKEEYDKLREYDLPMHLQPSAIFACHAAPNAICNGWACVHGDTSLALRIQCHRAEKHILVPHHDIPLFRSGTAAAKHGEKDIERPKAAARIMTATLLAKHKHLRDNFESKSK